MPDENFTLTEGDLFHGRYQIVRRIGAGGMGAVYEVLDEKTERSRALKVMLPKTVSSPDLRRRFRREATVAAKIVTDHICEILDAGVDDDTGSPFMVLELLEGRDLDELSAERGPLPADEVVHYLGQAALALDKAHAAGVVHRDLKPENLYLTHRDDGSPRIKILDFGIAKVMAGTVSGHQTQGILGTPLFMAPEQVHGEAEVAPGADVYALTHIAYALLVGEPYFLEEENAARSVYQLILSISRGPTESACARAQRHQVHLPAAFDRWFDTGTAADPKDRHASAGKLIDHLAATLGVRRADTFTPGMKPYLSRAEIGLLRTAPTPVITQLPDTPKMVEPAPMTEPLPSNHPLGRTAPLDRTDPLGLTAPLGGTMESADGGLAAMPQPAHPTAAQGSGLEATRFEAPAAAPTAAPRRPSGVAPTQIDRPSPQLPSSPYQRPPHAAPQAGDPSSASLGAATAAPVSHSLASASPKRSRAPLVALALLGLGVVGAAVWAFGTGDEPVNDVGASAPTEDEATEDEAAEDRFEGETKATATDAEDAPPVGSATTSAAASAEPPPPAPPDRPVKRPQAKPAAPHPPPPKPPPPKPTSDPFTPVVPSR